MDVKFHGKRALVTGAGKGIGRGIAKALVESGAETYALSRTKEDLDSLKAELPSINTVCVDMADWDTTRKAVVEIGPIDLLVNNAAISIGLKPFIECDMDDFDTMMNINVKATFNISQVAAKGMVERGKGGAIVNISSQLSQRGMLDHTVYCAAKGALDGMTRVMALELGPHQIRVNSVHPTVVLTAMGRYAWKDDSEKTKVMKSRIPQGKFAEIEDVVRPVLYLLSDKADMINGAFLPVDGGYWVT